jgi:hypothetical protein
MAVTVATVIKNLCWNRRQNANLESSRIGIQTLASLTHLVAQKHDQIPAVQSVHNLSRTETELQGTVATKPYVETSCISNHQKAKFVGDVFHIRCFWGRSWRNFTKTCFIQECMMCQKC